MIYIWHFICRKYATNRQDWYIGWWALHLDTSTSQTLSLLTAPADASPGGGQVGSWSGVSTDTDIDIYQQNGWPADQWVGAYNLGIDKIGSVDKDTGAQVNDGDVWTWTFTFTGLSAEQFLDPPNFQVGYYNIATTAGAGGPFPRLSQELTQVPEPGTFLLLGSGLLGLPMLRKKRRG